MLREQLIADLTPFGDIGDDVVKVHEQGGKFSVKMTREARPLKLMIEKESGKIQSSWGAASPRNFSSLKSMLASEIFANLKRWADAQRDLLRRDIPSGSDLLPIQSVTHDETSIQSLEQVDELLGSKERPADSVEILLIDGPAGIGKTSLIEQLALRRAEAFRTSSCPLILHVKSRGRVLSNLQDLMAFSLQTIRSHITYDQIPVLAKYGLIVIAIDGFDELADPNGYEMAWAQLSELVTFVRGSGTLILAGRDTFIGRNRLLKDMNALREGVDVVNGLTLKSPLPAQAKVWLKHNQWTLANFSIPSISVLLEDGSFALRPVFLRILAKYVKPRELKDKHERYLTPLLVNQMIEREAELFGKPVNALMDQQARQKFLFDFLCEIARQMADSQVEALEAGEVAWISETVLGDEKPKEVVSLIKNRASVIEFFVKDERPGYLTFMHAYLLSYFLAIVAIDAIGNGEIPKFIRRNLLGAEFLSVFSDVAAEFAVSSKEKFEKFWSRASALAFSYMSADRGLRNVGALALAALPAVAMSDAITLGEFEVDDAVIKGSCPPASLENVGVGQLDCRGADLSALIFSNVRIGTLIADQSLRVSTSFPSPTKIVLAGEDPISTVEGVSSWLGKHGRDLNQTVSTGLASATLRKKPIYKLLSRAARLRQYWLRGDNDDIQAAKIINDPSWESLSEILTKHGYLREELRQASGRASPFFHIKHRDSILVESPADEKLKGLFDDLLKA